MVEPAGSERTAPAYVGRKRPLENRDGLYRRWPSQIPGEGDLMATLSFAAQVASFAERVPEAVEAVRNQSAADVVKEMQTLDSEGGRLPYDTGFLWASLMASTSAMPSINRN